MPSLGHIICTVLASVFAISGFIPHNLVNPFTLALARFHRGIYSGIPLDRYHPSLPDAKVRNEDGIEGEGKE